MTHDCSRFGRAVRSVLRPARAGCSTCRAKRSTGVGPVRLQAVGAGHRSPGRLAGGPAGGAHQPTPTKQGALSGAPAQVPFVISCTAVLHVLGWQSLGSHMFNDALISNPHYLPRSVCPKQQQYQ